MIDAYLERWANEQADLMLDMANSMFPSSFRKDCLECLANIREHWKARINVRYVKQFDDGSQYEDSHGLRGLYMPAASAEERPTLIVAQQRVSSRMGFALLHELGHYLQDGNVMSMLELFARKQVFKDRGIRKNAEERACDLFAVKALLPDTLIAKYAVGDPSADWILKLYENSSASRQVIVRRIAPMLKSGSWITLMNLDRDPSLRAYADGYVEYSEPVQLPIECAAALRMRLKNKTSQTFLREDFAEASIGDPDIISVARPKHGSWMCAVAVKL